MKKVMVLFAAFMLLGSLGAFAGEKSKQNEVRTTNALTEVISKDILPLSWQQTSICGVRYTITAPFCPCSGFEIYLMQQQAQIEIDALCPQGPPIPS